MSLPHITMTAKCREHLDAGFFAAFGKMPLRYFSAPGRTEIGGNHTDHQHGRVLAAAVDIDVRAAVRPNDENVIRVCSEGYPLYEISLDALSPKADEAYSAASLIRGTAAGFARKGCDVGGFDAYCISDVLPGSGLSSSAAFEVLMGTVINGLFFEEKLSAPEIAKIGQYAENVYFGKPCGLMDQTASAVGGLVSVVFFDKDAPIITPVRFDFSACGHTLCIIHTGPGHEGLTPQYAAVTAEMKSVANAMGCEVLGETEEADFLAALPRLRQQCSDRALLRAMHFYGENARAAAEVQALANGDLCQFLRLVNESGRSSYMYLQNVIPEGSPDLQQVGLALALCERHLEGRGACRVHGGGFAGTVQAFVPNDMLEGFTAGMENVFGTGSCRALNIRPEGGAEIIF